MSHSMVINAYRYNNIKKKLKLTLMKFEFSKVVILQILKMKSQDHRNATKLLLQLSSIYIN